MKVRLHNFLYLLLGLLGFKSSAAFAAEQVFLCDPDGAIQGESTAKGYENCIDVLAWSWGGSVSSSGGTGGGGGTGTVLIQDLAVSKYIDKSTPDLMAFMTTGTNLPTLQLFVLEQCGSCEPFNKYRLVMENVLITSVDLSGASGAEATEHVTLNFSKVEWCARDAAGGQETCKNYDIQVASP